MYGAFLVSKFKHSMQTCNPSIQICNPSIQTCNPSLQTSNLSNQTFNPSIQTCNPFIQTSSPFIQTLKTSILGFKYNFFQLKHFILSFRNISTVMRLTSKGGNVEKRGFRNFETKSHSVECCCFHLYLWCVRDEDERVSTGNCIRFTSKL